ncbi:hypothetical protein AB0J21_08645 [Streptomyces sp. NPDC049954]|uniref:hypothetical protein n=1 Tax=Streptomyces sp. NPDC049954 TaxID=3155779 RepID=UPI003438B815
MPTTRLRTGAAAAAVVAAGIVCAPGTAAYADRGPATGPALRLEPASVAPGTTVTVRTAACGSGAATGSAPAVREGSFLLGADPATGESVGRFTVPATVEPGTYEVVARCGSGKADARGDLTVGLDGAYGPAGHAAGHGGAGNDPGGAGSGAARGAARTTAAGPGPLGSDPVRVACGIGVLACAAAAGTWLLHRRARGVGL